MWWFSHSVRHERRRRLRCRTTRPWTTGVDGDEAASSAYTIGSWPGSSSSGLRRRRTLHGVDSQLATCLLTDDLADPHE
ncbi:hypothetical protein PHMEG_0003751, partial [Phytophthora megakarya]